MQNKARRYKEEESKKVSENLNNMYETQAEMKIRKRKEEAEQRRLHLESLEKEKFDKKQQKLEIKQKLYEQTQNDIA